MVKIGSEFGTVLPSKVRLVSTDSYQQITYFIKGQGMSEGFNTRVILSKRQAAAQQYASALHGVPE